MLISHRLFLSSQVLKSGAILADLPGTTILLDGGYYMLTN
jgi:hypothetical protein